MNTEEDEFRRIEAEAKRRAQADDDDDTQVYADTLTIVYQRGFADGKKAVQQAEPMVDCPRCGHVCSQRQWVGLTDEEMSDIVADIDVDFGDLLWKVVCLTKIIQAELKERNA